MSWIEIVRVCACVLVVLSAARFCYRYNKKTSGKWRDNPYGKHMMTFSGAFVVYFLYAAVSLLLFPDSWRPYVGSVLILSLAGLFEWRTRLVDVAQRERVHAETEEE